MSTGRTIAPRVWLWAGAVLGSAACSSPFDSNEQLVLAQARQRWASRGKGAVLSVTLLETGALLAPADLVHWYTIEQLFDRITATADQEGVDDVRVI